MADVPGWLKFLAEAGKAYQRSAAADLEAECKEQYEDGYRTARRGEEARMQLIAEDSRYYRAWMAGDRAGSE